MVKELILNSAIECNIQAYGLFHVAFTVIGVTLSIVITYKLKGLTSKQNDRLLLFIAIVLMILEVYKQLFYFYSNDNTYQWNIFPFHLCSIPMYLCVICYFTKSVILKNTMYHFMATFNLLGAGLSFVEPSGLIHEYLFLTLHAFIWHMLIVFIGIYLIITKRVNTKLCYFFFSCILFVILCVIAFVINCLFYKASHGTINMFFVGPNVNNLAVFCDIGKATSWYIATIVYIPCVMIGAWLIKEIIKKRNELSDYLDNAWNNV